MAISLSHLPGAGLLRRLQPGGSRTDDKAQLRAQRDEAELQMQLATATSVDVLGRTPLRDMTGVQLTAQIDRCSQLLRDLEDRYPIPAEIKAQMEALDALEADPTMKIPQDWADAGLPDPWPLEDEPDWQHQP